MFTKTIAGKTERVFKKIAESKVAEDFYLAGGTALALEFGHRKSDDLDFFSVKKFSNGALKKTLAKIGKFELTGEDKGTIHGNLDGVKVSFLHYGYKLLYPGISFEGIKLADERDIAAMKIDAASSRGSRKDFVDIYFLMEKYSLSELLGFFETKYKDIKYNKLHILKSLVFFGDAETEPMPAMIEKLSWKEVKKKIAAEANKIL
jgi:Nucleotidyl transferase AbiEii toxin, Type IV TA system